MGPGVEEPVEDTEAVLAAYRERKRQALASRDASESAPVAAPAAPAPSTPRPVADPPAAPHTPSPSAHAPSPPAAHAVPAGPASGIPSGAGAPQRALELHRPAGPVSAPGATLSALGPTLRLSDALLKDRTVALRGSPRARAAGVAMLLVGLGLAVLERRQAAIGSPVPGLDLLAVLLVLAGAATALLGMVLPRRRRLAVRLAASQKEEWTRIQHETGRLQTLSRVGLALSVLGLLLLVAAYSLASLGLLVAGAGLAIVGLPLLVTAQVRRSLARRLYVQTLVLSGLEASGLGGAGPDDRVQPVILALDRLLGALPEHEVQAFLATPQAKAYLELVDEATRSQRGP